MAIDMRYLLFYWAFFLGICDGAYGQVVTAPPAPSGGAELRKCLVRTALSQTRVRERTGRNDGGQVMKYLKILHLPEGTPYCGAFIEWVFQQCGLQSNVQSPAVAYSWIRYPNRVIWRNGPSGGRKLPQPGDVAVFAWRQRTGGVRYHSELVLEWDSDEETEDFVTVGGNTSAPSFVKVKGEGVHRKLREKEEATVSDHVSFGIAPKPRPLF